MGCVIILKIFEICFWKHSLNLTFLTFKDARYCNSAKVFCVQLAVVTYLVSFCVMKSKIFNLVHAFVKSVNIKISVL